jgi:hypothetical protein
MVSVVVRPEFTISLEDARLLRGEGEPDRELGDELAVPLVVSKVSKVSTFAASPRRTLAGSPQLNFSFRV